MRQHPTEVTNALAGLDDDSEQLTRMTLDMWKAEGGSVCLFDLYANGAINRSFSLASGFRAMIEGFNILCAGAILRLQIDTALRFHAAYLYPNANDFAEEVMKGNEVRKLRDRDRQLMHDAYLVISISIDYPWVAEVYRKTSGFIHMSETHFYSPYGNVNREAGVVQIALTGLDEKLPTETYLDAIATFRAATSAFKDHLAGWILLKSTPSAGWASLREQPASVDGGPSKAYLSIDRA